MEEWLMQKCRAGVFVAAAVGCCSIASAGQLTPSQPQDRYVTSDGSNTHATTPGTTAFGVDHTGVGEITVGGITGTASLLPTGLHVITAAHLFGGSGGLSNSSVRFDLPGGPLDVSASAVLVHPSFSGDSTEGFDVAVVTLSPTAQQLSALSGVTRYQIYAGDDAIGVPSVKVGYGDRGHGDTGSINNTSGIKRAGLNMYDVDSYTMLFDMGGQTGVNPFPPEENDPPRELPAPGTTLAYDFDNGIEAQNTLGSMWFDYASDTGFGDDEVLSSPGDSGGPTFIEENGVFKIAGITSYGFGFDGGPDVTPGEEPSSSFGEIGVDMQVGAQEYQGFLAAFLVPEPAGLPLLILSLTALTTRRGRRG